MDLSESTAAKVWCVLVGGFLFVLAFCFPQMDTELFLSKAALILGLICPFILKLFDANESANMFTSFICALLYGSPYIFWWGSWFIFIISAFLFFFESILYAGYVYGWVDEVKNHKATKHNPERSYLIGVAQKCIQQRREICKKLLDMIQAAGNHKIEESVITLLDYCSEDKLKADFINKQQSMNEKIILQVKKESEIHKLNLDMTGKSLSQIEELIKKRCEQLENDEETIFYCSIEELRQYKN